MKRWQQIVEEHHFVEILSETQVKVLGVIYTPATKTSSDDIVTRTENGYTDSFGNNYESIFDYLGY